MFIVVIIILQSFIKEPDFQFAKLVSGFQYSAKTKEKRNLPF